MRFRVLERRALELTNSIRPRTITSLLVRIDMLDNFLAPVGNSRVKDYGSIASYKDVCVFLLLYKM